MRTGSSKIYIVNDWYNVTEAKMQREDIRNEIRNILKNFDTECRNITFKKGIYIYGAPGSGKTFFVVELLKELGYDVIKYDAGDVRNKALIETITCDNISNRNVLDMMYGRRKPIAILMDEIDGMNNGDKGGITQLIKLIRQKKTKKQKLESITLNPIVCIGNYNMDKKMKELMKVCHVFELKMYAYEEMKEVLYKYIPDVESKIPIVCIPRVVEYVQGDFRKMEFMIRLITRKPEIFQREELLSNILQMKNYNDDAKQITKSLINKPIEIKMHPTFMNETDRTIVSLLFHENIVDAFTDDKQLTLNVYTKILNCICFADHIDRITFQLQIWVFNEISSLIKTFATNRIFHITHPNVSNTYNPTEVRFTKVLTKYSTEYNNQLFFYNMCQELDMDKKDVVALFQELRILFGISFCSNNEKMAQVENLFEDTTIRSLDIKRMYRFLDKKSKTEEIMDEIGDNDS